MDIAGCEDSVTIGGGPRGAVYRVLQRDTGRRLAVRVGGRVGPVPRIPATAIPTHPGLVTVHETGVGNGYSFTVMEYMEGGDLASLPEPRAIATHTAVAMVATLADGVRALHDAGLVHGCVSPRNVLFDRAGHGKLGDPCGCPDGSVDAARVTDLAGLGVILQCALPATATARAGVGSNVPPQLRQHAELLAFDPAAIGDAGTVVTLLREWAAAIAGANPPRDRVPRRRLAAIAGPALALGVTAVVVAFFVFAEPALPVHPQQTAAPSNATSSTATATAAGSAPAGLPAPSTTAPSSGPSSIATAATPTTATAAVPSPPAGDSAPATTSSPALPALAANRPQMLAWTGSRLVYTDTTRGGVGFVTPDAATTPSATVAAVVPTGADPGGLAIGFGSVWVASARDGTVARLDAGTLSPQALITVGRAPVSIATGHDKTWVVNLVDATVSVIDPRTNTVEGTVAVGGEPFGVAVGATAIWVTNTVDGTVSRIDPTSRSVSATYPVGIEPVGIVEWRGGVWVANRADGTLVRLDLQTGQVTTTVPVGVGVSGIAAGPVSGAVATGPLDALVAVNPELRAYRVIVEDETPGIARRLAEPSEVPLIAAGNIVFPSSDPGSVPGSFQIANLTGG